MEKVIESLMTSPGEANAAFDILRDLHGATGADDPLRLIGGLQLLDPDIVRVLLAILVAEFSVEEIDALRRDFLAEIFGTETKESDVA